MESLHYLLMADHTMIHKALVNSIKDTGMTVGQPKVLDFLCTHDGCIQKDIAEGCHIEPATLSVLLGGMEEKGLIERRSLNGNRRSLNVYLTPKGKEDAMLLQYRFKAIEETAQKGLTDKERATLRSLLEKVYENMQEERNKELNEKR